MSQLFYKTKSRDETGQINFDLLILNMLQSLKEDSIKRTSIVSNWVIRLKGILYFKPEFRTSLSHLNEDLNIHPVHLSRESPNSISDKWPIIMNT